MLEWKSCENIKIIFTHHAIEKKTERPDWLVRTNHYGETRRMKPQLESLLRFKGVWYINDETDDGITKFYCVVNQLEVYCGIMVEDNEILITTYYPYSKRIKRRLFPRGRASYERFILS